MKAAQQRVPTAVQTRGGVNHHWWYMRTIGVIVRRFARTTVQLPGSIMHPWCFIHTLHVIVRRNTKEEKGILGNPQHPFTDIEIGEAMSEAGVPGGMIASVTDECVRMGVLMPTKTPTPRYRLTNKAWKLLRGFLNGS